MLGPLTGFALILIAKTCYILDDDNNKVLCERLSVHYLCPPLTITPEYSEGSILSENSSDAHDLRYPKTWEASWWVLGKLVDPGFKGARR